MLSYPIRSQGKENTEKILAGVKEFKASTERGMDGTPDIGKLDPPSDKVDTNRLAPKLGRLKV